MANDRCESLWQRTFHICLVTAKGIIKFLGIKNSNIEQSNFFGVDIQ